MAEQPWILATSEETFQADVLERSREVPVVLDFWAAWCQPCRMLMPKLEALANEYQGQFVLVKANTDECPNAANAFGVEGIPAVYGLRAGALVNSFNGLLSDDQLREWIESILPSDAERLVAEAKELQTTDAERAEEKLREAMVMEPNNVEIKVALARLLFEQDRLDEAHKMLDHLGELGLLDQEGEELKAELALKTSAQHSGGLAAVREALAADPNNLDLQMQFAESLIGEKQYADALETCLQVLQKDKAGHGPQARELMVNVFQVLGNEHPLTSEYRRRLSLALY